MLVSVVAVAAVAVALVDVNVAVSGGDRRPILVDFGSGGLVVGVDASDAARVSRAEVLS